MVGNSTHSTDIRVEAATGKAFQYVQALNHSSAGQAPLNLPLFRNIPNHNAIIVYFPNRKTADENKEHDIALNGAPVGVCWSSTEV